MIHSIRRPRLVAAAGLCLAAASAALLPAFAAEPPAVTKPAAASASAPSNTRFATRQLRIRTPSGGADDMSDVLMRLKSKEVAGAIGKDLLGVSPEEASSAVVQTDSFGDNGYSGVRITVMLDPARLPNARPAAREFADRLAARFPELLAEERANAEAPQLADAKQRYDQARADYEAAVSQLREKQAVLGGQTPAAARAALTRLEEEQQRIELDLAGMQARQKAVEDWIDRTSRQAQEQAKADPVVAELEKAVAAQEAVLERTQKLYASGQVSQSEVGDREMKLSDVKIQLLEHKRGSAGAAGATGSGAAADPLAALTRELQTVAIDVVDRKARLAYIEKRIGPLREAAAMSTDFEVFDAERAATRRELEQARQDVRAAQQAFRSAPRDRVTVVESRDSEEPKNPQ